MAESLKTVLSNVDKARRSVTTGNDQREEAMILQTTQINYEQYLIPAPMSISLLGQLILIASKQDFSLAENPPEGGWKHVKWPKSFRATLLQVAHSGWDAFNAAHSNMDQIRLYAMQTDTHLKNAVNILYKGTPHEVQHVLPIPLQQIESSAEQCLVLAKEVQQQFGSVKNIIAELLEATTQAKGTYAEKLVQAQAAREVAELNKDLYEKQKKQREDEFNLLKKQMEKHSKLFEESIEGIPSGWKLLGLSAAGALMDGLKSVTSALVSRSLKTNESSQTENPVKKSEKDNTYSAPPQVLQYARIINEQAVLLKSFIKEDGKALQFSTNFGDPSSVICKVKTMLTTIQDNIGSENTSTEKDPASRLCAKGIEVCNKLLNHKKDFVEKDHGETVKEINNFFMETAVFSGVADSVCNRCSVSPKGPHLSDVPVPDISDSFARAELLNARFKVEHTRSQLQETQQRYDAVCKEMERTAERYADTMAKIQKHLTEEVNFNSIKEVLKEGLQVLGELEKRWSNLVMFFQTVVNLVEVALRGSTNMFVKYANTDCKNAIGSNDYSLSSIMRDIIYHQTFEAIKMTYVIKELASAYFTVSEKHFMPQISQLTVLMTLENPQEIKSAQLKLQDDCKKAETAIRTILNQHKLEYKTLVSSRIEKLDKELKAMLPPISKDEADVVNNGVALATAKAREVSEEFL